MAGTAVSKKQEFVDASVVESLRSTVNKLVADVETIRVAYSAHQHAALNAAPSTNPVLAAGLTANLVNVFK